MKKIFAIVLALTLVMSMGTTALAAETTLTPEDSSSASASIDINGKVLGQDDEVEVVSVDISYGSMEFVWVASGSKGVWNPADHTYGSDTTEGAWEVQNNSNTLTVTNHSNVAVGVKAEAAMDASVVGDSVNATIDKADVQTLSRGVENEYDSAPNTKFVLTLDGEPTANFATDFTVIGSITVSIEVPTEATNN